MKKSIFTMSMTALALLCLSSCNNGAKKTINIQFVPSNDPGKLATLASKMAPMLEAIEPGYKFNITTGTSYAATTQGLL